jgi:hypothetical protein
MEGGVGGGDSLAPSLGNSWRTTTDIQDNWASMIDNINNVRRYYMSHVRLFLYHFHRTMILLNLQDQVVGMIPIVSYHFTIVD